MHAILSDDRYNFSVSDFRKSFGSWISLFEILRPWPLCVFLAAGDLPVLVLLRSQKRKSLHHLRWIFF